MSRAPPTKPAHLQSACSTAVPACHRPHGEGEALASAAVFSLRFKRHTQGGATPNTSNFLPSPQRSPVRVMGSVRLMETTPFHLEFLCARVTLISKFT